MHGQMMGRGVLGRSWRVGPSLARSLAGIDNLLGIWARKSIVQRNLEAPAYRGGVWQLCWCRRSVRRSLVLGIPRHIMVL
jgi:hypothetical protein